MDKQEIEKLYNMIKSDDQEIRNLGITIIEHHSPDLKKFGRNFWGYPSDSILEAELVRYTYRSQNNKAERELIFMWAKQRKNEAIKSQDFERACFFRDIEKYLCKQE